MDRLFTKIPIPGHHRRDIVAVRAHWYSWSSESIDLVRYNADRIHALSYPRCISVPGCEPYDSTYTYRLSALPGPLIDLALDSAESLLRVRPGRRMRFFSGMFSGPFSSPVLHKYFALIRAGVIWIQGDPRSALHAPVHTERTDDGFPLHADLFLTNRLWLVFDDVPEGRSGTALFLPRHVLDAAIQANPHIPPSTRERLRRLLDGGMGTDSFDQCFDLLHSRVNPWTASLAKVMKRRRWEITLQRGEGYLLHDRRWLHGRTAVNGHVSSARFRRLVYGNLTVEPRRQTV
jgi:hypothetical protein